MALLSSIILYFRIFLTYAMLLSGTIRGSGGIVKSIAVATMTIARSAGAQPPGLERKMLQDDPTHPIAFQSAFILSPALGPWLK
jgi:hypothetical protein